MNSNFKILRSWLSSLNLKEQREPKLEDIHIDELVYGTTFRMKKEEKEALFFKSLDLFYDLIHLDFGYDIHQHYVPSLVFRLGWSKKILLNVKQSNIWEEFDETPPNFYLAPKKYFFPSVAEGEKYKKPLFLDVFKKFQEDCAINYYCFRGLEEMRKDWEYARNICIDNFGKNNSGYLDDQYATLFVNRKLEL